MGDLLGYDDLPTLEVNVRNDGLRPQQFIATLTFSGVKG